MDSFKELAEAPTVGNSLLTSIVLKEEAESDETWFPYIYIWRTKLFVL